MTIPSSNYVETARNILVVLIGVAIPTSVALTNVLLPLALLLLLVDNRYRQHFYILRTHPLTLPPLLLFGVMVGGMMYATVSWHESLAMLDKYRELLYIPLFILLFREEKVRHWGIVAFIGTMAATLVLSYFVVLSGCEIFDSTIDNPTLFKNYITQGILISLAAYLLAVQCWPTRGRYLCGVGILLAVYNVGFMTPGRTGYVVLASLILLFAYQHYRWRGLLTGSLGIIILSAAAYTTSEIVQTRIHRISQNLENYQQGHTVGSVALRIEFYKNSLVLIAKNPLFGSGTGSFYREYTQLAQGQELHLTTNPHNEYLMIAVQWGLLGLGLFVYLLYRLWQLSYRLSPSSRQMMQGLALTIGIGCLFNSLLLDNTEGHLFAYLTGVFYAELSATHAGHT